jgi:hypothetical protein
MKRTVLLSVFVWLIAGTALAQRLPKIAAPESYTLTLTPNFDKENFIGDETIQIKVLKPTTNIVLNTVDISLQNVTITARNHPQTGSRHHTHSLYRDSQPPVARLLFGQRRERRQIRGHAI